jgi:hypothetical protein
MKGRSGDGRAAQPVSAAPHGGPEATSPILGPPRCLAAGSGTTAPSGPDRRGRVWGGSLDPLTGLAAADASAPAPGLSRRHGPLDRPDGARGVPVGGSGRGRLSAFGSVRPGGAGESGSRRACALGSGPGARPGGNPGYRAPGQLGGARRVVGHVWDAGLGDLPSVPGEATRSFRAGAAGAGRGARNPGGRTTAAGVAGAAAGRDPGDSPRPRASGRVGGVYVLRSGVSCGLGACTAVPGCGGARRPGMSGLPAGRHAGAFRAGHRPGGGCGRRRSWGGCAGDHAAAGAGVGGLDP